MSKKTKVLIVDDEKRFRNTMVKIFNKQGLAGKAVGGGDEALEELATNKYDVVLLDVKMPGISGVEVLKRMKKQGCKAEVIILTGHASVDIALEIMNHGAYDYLLKPCATEKILQKISMAYERKLEKEKQT